MMSSGRLVGFSLRNLFYLKMMSSGVGFAEKNIIKEKKKKKKERKIERRRKWGQALASS